ncbi:MAG: hypothetical protein ACI9OU_000215 [Candidatus Promineifilaceae bacterium]|jgi:hypothetical protein
MSEKRGSVLILALWSLFFLGALALAVAGYVSAALDSARFMRNETQAYFLARAGVDKAVAVVLGDESYYTNFHKSRHPDLRNDFKDQALGEFGSFSVQYAFMSNVSEQAYLVQTNFGFAAYGVGSDTRDRINIDWGVEDPTRHQLNSLGIDADVVDSILSYDPQSIVANDRKRSYCSFFGSAQELLVIDGLGIEEYSQLEPVVTIGRFAWQWPEQCVRGEQLQSYGGLAQGVAEVEHADGSREVLASSRITFVFRIDTNTAEGVQFLHWREH